MNWLFLFTAILMEVAGTTSMKLSQGFTKMLPSVLIFVFYVLSLSFLNLALKKIDVSIAYTVWSGLGTVMITAIGIIMFKEAVSTIKLVSILMVIAGVIGLNMSGIGH